MLHVSDLQGDLAERMASATPGEYLRNVQQAEIIKTCRRWNATFRESGLEFFVDDLCLWSEVTDKNKFHHYMSSSFGSNVPLVPLEALPERGSQNRVLDLADHALQRFATNLSREVASALPREWANRLREVPIGVTPSHYWNAGAEPVPGGGDIITLNLGLEHLTGWNAYVVERSEPPPDQETINNMGRFATLITGTAGIDQSLGEMGARGFALECRAIAAADEYLTFLYSTQLAWVLVHEILHIVLGHTDYVRANPIEPKMNDSRREIIHNMELEADGLALPFLFGFAESQKVSAFAVIDAVLLALRCLHFAEHVTQHKPLTHPSATDRITHLIKLLPGDDFRKLILERPDREVFIVFGRPYFHVGIRNEA